MLHYNMYPLATCSTCPNCSNNSIPSNLELILMNVKKKRVPRHDDTIQHFAIFFKRGASEKETLTIGENQIVGRSTYFFMSTHAEIDALNKLKSKKFVSTKTRFDLMVIRISKTGVLGESRPCFHCLETLENSGVKIHNVYYSTKSGTLTKERFSTMKESDKTVYSSGYRKNMKNLDKPVQRFVYN